MSEGSIDNHGSASWLRMTNGKSEPPLETQLELTSSQDFFFFARADSVSVSEREQQPLLPELMGVQTWAEPLSHYPLVRWDITSVYRECLLSLHSIKLCIFAYKFISKLLSLHEIASRSTFLNASNNGAPYLWPPDKASISWGYTPNTWTNHRRLFWTFSVWACISSTSTTTIVFS